ncbi:MAG: hypothetical protein O2816_04490 [Planctomycetota bacterium]|nr:hypothetical protein [Planctomycetota bacterium]
MHPARQVELDHPSLRGGEAQGTGGHDQLAALVEHLELQRGVGRKPRDRDAAIAAERLDPLEFCPGGEVSAAAVDLAWWTVDAGEQRRRIDGAVEPQLDLRGPGEADGARGAGFLSADPERRRAVAASVDLVRRRLSSRTREGGTPTFLTDRRRDAAHRPGRRGPGLGVAPA